MGDVVAGLTVFMNTMQQKDDALKPYLKQLDTIEVRAGRRWWCCCRLNNTSQVDDLMC